MTMLDEIEQDVLTELINIAIGQAAKALSELVGDPIKLSVPKIQFISTADAVKTVDAHTNKVGSAIREGFKGPFDGQMLLIFPEQQSLELVRQLIGEDVELDTITEMEQDALMEIGNIIMTSCLASLADAFEVTISNELPKLIKGSGEDMIATNGDQGDFLIMFLDIDFHLSKSDISGNIVLVLDLKAVGQLKDYLAKYMDSI